MEDELIESQLHAAPELPDRYQFQQVIGSGGMGLVVQALDRELEQSVAIKVMHENLSQKIDLQQRFLREAKTLAQLDHANIVKIKTFGVTENGSPYQVVELLSGQCLAGRLKHEPLKADEFLLYMQAVASGLEYAQSKGVVHRDIKPSNIFLAQQADGSCEVKILDFGIARIESAAQEATLGLTGSQMALGSPLYMSPEQSRGQKADYLSDIYSLGCVMYECLTGKPPFQGETPLETMYQHCSATPPPIQGQKLSAQPLIDLTMSCLEKDPARRPQSYEQIKNVLLAATALSDTVSLGIKRPAGDEKARKMQWFWPALAAMALSAGAFGWLTIHEKNQKELSSQLDGQSGDLRLKELYRQFEHHQERVNHSRNRAERQENSEKLMVDCGNLLDKLAGVDTVKAEYYARKAVELASDSPHPLLHEICGLRQLGNFLKRRKRYAEADDCYNKAIAICKKNPHPTLIHEQGVTSMEQGIMHGLIGNYKLCRREVSEGLSYLKHERDETEIGKKFRTSDYRLGGPLNIWDSLKKCRPKDPADQLELSATFICVAATIINYGDQGGTAENVLKSADELLDTAATCGGDRKQIDLMENQLKALRQEAKALRHKES